MEVFARLLDSILQGGGLEAALRRCHLPCRRLVAFEDFVQEVLLSGLRSALSFRGQSEAELAGWLQAIAQQRMIDVLRRSRREQRSPLPEEWLDQRAGSPFEDAVKREQLAWLARALAALDGDDRELLLCHYWDGESFSDMARRQGMPPNTIIQRHRRLLEHLRQWR